MLLDKLKDIPIVLGSQSPRRRELLAALGLEFEVLVKETDESFDPSLSPAEIVKGIALAKLSCFQMAEFAAKLVITADTVVVHDGQILGKPRDAAEAVAMLKSLQGSAHAVLTAVAIAYRGETIAFVEETEVDFAPLSDQEITYYVEHFKPYDKAGSYGIQEWIGVRAVKAIHGSYENVVGLPTARLYQELMRMFAL